MVNLLRPLHQAFEQAPPGWLGVVDQIGAGKQAPRRQGRQNPRQAREQAGPFDRHFVRQHYRHARFGDMGQRFCARQRYKITVLPATTAGALDDGDRVDACMGREARVF